MQCINIEMMNLTDIQRKELLAEVQFSAVRSSGPGGQNVNKVSSKIELRFAPAQSRVLTDEQRDRLLMKLKASLTAEGCIIVTAQESRSQTENKAKAIEKLFAIIDKALFVAKKRKPSTPTYASIMKRLDDKRRHSAKKMLRRANWD